MIIPQSSIRVEEYLSKLVESRLAEGKITKIDTKDLMRLVKLGVCTVPSYIDIKDPKALGPFCATVLVRLRPNGGSTKRERFGPGFRYEFIPKEVKS